MMRVPPSSLLLLVILCLVSASAPQVPPAPPAALEDSISVYFSPGGGCTGALVDAISSAKTSLDIAIYSITQKDIAKAIVQAHKRGVRVRVILDNAQASSRYSSATFLSNQGISVWTSPTQSIHHKYSLIDGAIICTGSFNYSARAEDYNAENLLVIRDKPKLAAAYQNNFEGLLATAIPYERKKK